MYARDCRRSVVFSNTSHNRGVKWKCKQSIHNLKLWTGDSWLGIDDEINPESCPAHHRVADRRCPFYGGCQIIIRSLTVDHGGYRVRRVSRFIHIKDLFCRSLTRVVHCRCYKRLNCSSLLNSSHFFHYGQVVACSGCLIL